MLGSISISLLFTTVFDFTKTVIMFLFVVSILKLENAPFVYTLNPTIPRGGADINPYIVRVSADINPNIHRVGADINPNIPRVGGGINPNIPLVGGGINPNIPRVGGGINSIITKVGGDKAEKLSFSAAGVGGARSCWEAVLWQNRLYVNVTQVGWYIKLYT